jgi:hypothetical protein
MMRILIMTAIMGLPLMALGQTEPQKTTTQGQTETTTQGQTEETQATAPAEEKKMHPAQKPSKPHAKPETVREQTKAKGGVRDATRNEAGMRSSTSKTKVNVQEFRSRHREVFTLGRHPKEFFVHRFGANHFRLIGNTYFVFVDSCWVAVDVDGFVYTERVICQGDPDFVVVY